MASSGPITARTPRQIVRQVKGWRCRLGIHRWKLASVCGRAFGVTRYHAWEVYEECVRCGEERSYYELNERVADALDEEARRVSA